MRSQKQIKLITIITYFLISFNCTMPDDQIIYKLYSFEDLFTQEGSASQSFIDNVYYAEPVVDDNGNIFVATENYTVNVYNTDNLQLLSSFNFDANYVGTIDNPIVKMQVDGNYLFTSTHGDFQIFNIANINNIFLHVRDTLDRPEDSYAYDFIKLNDYIYIPTEDGLNIYKFSNGIFSFVKSVDLELTNLEQESIYISRIFNYENYIYIVIYSIYENTTRSVITLDLSDDLENPALLSKKTDIDFKHRNLSLINNYFISCFGDFSVYEIANDGSLNEIFNEDPNGSISDYSYNGEIYFSNDLPRVYDISEKNNLVILTYEAPEYTRTIKYNSKYYLFEILNENTDGSSEVSIKKYFEN